MARSVVVQDSVGTVKLAVTTVADPAGTGAWYPANVRLLVVAAVAGLAGWSLLVNRSCPWGPATALAASAGAAMLAAKPAAAAAAAQAMMMRVLLNMLVSSGGGAVSPAVSVVTVVTEVMVEQ